jgi:hypothetical protein
MIVKTAVQQQWNITYMNDSKHLVISTGTVFGQEYHTIHPTNISVPALSNGYNPQWESMMQWCVATYGATGNVWQASEAHQRWYANNAKFWIRDDEDLTLFLLRWS